MVRRALITTLSATLLLLPLAGGHALERLHASAGTACAIGKALYSPG